MILFPVFQLLGDVPVRREPRRPLRRRQRLRERQLVQPERGEKAHPGLQSSGVDAGQFRTGPSAAQGRDDRHIRKYLYRR